MSSDMRRISLLLAVSASIVGLCASPLWGRSHHSHHYRRAVIEKVSVEEKGALRELGEKEISPSEPGTRYVIVVSHGAAKYSGEFYVQGNNDYPITLRPGQTVRFRTDQRQMYACDVNTVMWLVTEKYVVLRDPQGKQWDLFISSNLPPDFNADIRPGSALDVFTQH